MTATDTRGSSSVGIMLVVMKLALLLPALIFTWLDCR